MFGAGMSCAFIAISAGGGALLCMCALFVPMLLIAGYFGGKGAYSIDEKGISKSMTSYIQLGAFSNKLNESFSWSQVKSYKTGKDLNRSLNEYEYLEVRLPGGRIWQITNKANANEFSAFRDAFLQYAQGINSEASKQNMQTEPAAPHIAQQADTHLTMHASEPIKREKSFYEKPIARFFLWAMVLVVVGVVGFIIIHPQTISGATLFRLCFVLIPGTVYLFYRVYGKK